jgi:hypothetical protein
VEDEKMDDQARATKICNAILSDVTDRRGWRQEWDMFDADVRREIRRSWWDKILAILRED